MESTTKKICRSRSWARFDVALSENEGNASSPTCPPHETMNEQPLDEKKPVDKTTLDAKPVRQKAAEPQPVYNFGNEQPSYDADAEGKAKKLKYKKRRYITRQDPTEPETKVQVPALEPSELGRVLHDIYLKQDDYGRMVSHPNYIHKYIPKKFIEPYDVEKADALFQQFVTLNIDRLLYKEDPIEMIGPRHGGEDNKKRFLLVWYGPREPSLHEVLSTSPYIAWAKDWSILEFDSGSIDSIDSIDSISSISSISSIDSTDSS